MYQCSSFLGMTYFLLRDDTILPKPGPPNYPLRDPKYHLIETIRPLNRGTSVGLGKGTTFESLGREGYLGNP